MCFDESMDLQARFSAEKRAFNMATLWYNDEFIRPFKRAQLFLSKCPSFVKLKFVEMKDLTVNASWAQFKRDISEVWMAALKKKRLMERTGMVDNDTNGLPEENLEITADVGRGDEEMVSLKCRTDHEGCGDFKYPAQKLKWLQDKFKADYNPPSRCVTCKAEYVKNKDASSFATDVNATDVNAEEEEKDFDAPANDGKNRFPPGKNRFGTRR